MVRIKDKEGDVWGWLDLTRNGWVQYEDGTSKKIDSGDIIFVRGKYAGKLLSEISDNWYLEFMKKQGVDNSDWFMEQCARLRLLEIKG